MIDTPVWLVPGAFVHVLGAGAGRVVDVCYGVEHVLVGLESAKCAARFQTIEWLDYTLDPGQWSLSTASDVLAEYEQELDKVRRAAAVSEQRIAAVTKSIEQLNEYTIA